MWRFAFLTSSGKMTEPQQFLKIQDAFNYCNICGLYKEKLQ